jgi:hypothetical protein
VLSPGQMRLRKLVQETAHTIEPDALWWPENSLQIADPKEQRAGVMLKQLRTNAMHDPVITTDAITDQQLDRPPVSRTYARAQRHAGPSEIVRTVPIDADAIVECPTGDASPKLACFGADKPARRSSLVTTSWSPARHAASASARPGRAAGAREAVVDVYAVGFDAEGSQGVALGGEVLGVGGDAGVADQEFGHALKCVPFVGRSPAHITEPPLRHTHPPRSAVVLAQGDGCAGGGSLLRRRSAWFSATLVQRASASAGA